MKRTMKKLTAFMLALLLFAGQMSTVAFAATSEGISLDVAPYAVEGSADRLDFDPYSDYVENEIYVTDEYLQPYPDDHEFETGDKLRFNIRFELEKSDALYGNWYNASECTYAIREAYRQGYFWGGRPTSLPQIDETTVFTIPFEGLGNLVGANLPWSYEQRQDGLIQQSSNVAFQWWLDKENEKVCIVFTKNALDGAAGYEALSNLYINVSGELDASALQDENNAEFTVGNVNISLPLAAECVPTKSVVMEYDTNTGNYVARYTISLDLNREVDLSKVPLNVMDTRKEGSIIGAPQNVAITSTSGDDVSVTATAVDGLSTRFDLASSDNILAKGSYTITYTAPLTGSYDELFGQNGSGFNALNYDQKSNTAQVYKGDSPTDHQSTAMLTYTSPSQTTALSKEVYQDYNNQSYINGIYEVRDQNGNTEYYATFYVDARIQNEANSLTITDDAGQWLSHINESPVVLYTQAGLVDWIDPSKLTTPENVSVTYNDNGNVRTFTISGSPLQPGAYRLMYRMKVKPEAVKEALATGKDLSIVNNAALTKLDNFPIDDRRDNASVTMPSYTETAKSYQIITLEDGTKLVQWQMAFRWNFFQQDGNSRITDTLSGGNYLVSAEYPMIILNNYQQIAKITDINTASDVGVDFAADGSSFTFTLGDTGNYNEKNNGVYIISYYTQLNAADENGVIPTQTNSYKTEYKYDNTVGGDSGSVVVDTTEEPDPDPDEPNPDEPDPDEPTPDEPVETPIQISPIKSVLSSKFDRATQSFSIKWEVAAELGQLPYERLESFVIADIIPADMADYMDITGVEVVARSADWGTLITLTENQHYTVEKTSDDRWSVSLDAAAVYETLPNAQWIGANFTTSAAQLPQGMSQCHNNAAELNYTYGDFDITTSCTGNSWYQMPKPEKTGWLQNQDAYNSNTGEYVYNQDGTGDIVWQIALKDANFLNRGETTTVTVTDTLPTIAGATGETITMMEILENTVSIQSAGHGYGGTKIGNFALQNNGSSFTLTFDVPANWPADSVYILYCCQLTDEYAASLKGDTYIPSVTNTADATWDNYTDRITGSSAMNVIDNRLMKSGSVAVDRSRINYTISINPKEFDLNADSDVVLITDTLNNANVTYLQNSFVLKDSDGNVLTRAASASATSYHLKFSDDGSSFQLEIPDNTSLVLTYIVEPTIEVGQETGNIGNTVEMAGLTKHHQINSFRADISSAGASTAVLLYGQRGVVVFKNDSETDIPLDGAEFTIYTVEADLTENPTSKTAVSTGGRILFRFTATEEGMGFDRVYCLRESQAPDGYTKTDEAWYFYFAQTDENGEEIAPSADVQAVLDALKAKDIPVTSDSSSKTYTFTAKNTPAVTADFSFTKVNENGVALDGAVFTLTDAEGKEIEAKVGAETGVFTYEELVAGSYVLTETAAPEGYDLPENASWTVTVAADGTVSVAGEGFNTTNNTITNVKTPEPVTADFSFTKVDENGVALDGAVFTLTDAEGKEIEAKVGTETGVFTYEALPVGTYTLTETAAPEGYNLPENASWTVTVAADGTVTVVGAGFDVDKQTITNTKTPEPVTAGFSFTKVDANGVALDGAVFTLSDAEGKEIEAKVGTEIGVFTYEALPVGTYTLTETAAPEGYDLPENTSWTVTVAEDGTVSVAGEGFNATNNTITNTKTPEPVTAVFSFTKVDANGVALAGAVFALTDAEGKEIEAKIGTETGVFTYEALPVGTYTLTETAAPEGYDLPENTSWTVTVAADGTVTVVGAGFDVDKNSITNVKTPEPEPITADFSFTKVDENGVALDGAVFTLSDAEGKEIEAKVGTETGVFTYEELVVGSYVLTETAAPEGYDMPENTSWTVTVAEDGTVTVVGAGFDVDKNTITNVKTPEPEPVTADFSFTKVDESGVALTGAVFTLTDAEGKEIEAKVGTETGVFTYEELVAGSYVLTETAAPEGYDLPENASWTVTVAEDGTVTVTGEGFNTTNNTITNVKTPEPVTADFSFTKVDENGVALAGATFTLTNANGETIAAKDNTETGVFTYEGLPVGTYTLTETAAPEGYDLPENASWTVTVAEDGTVTITGEGFNTTNNTITNVKTPEPEPITADFSFTKVDENGVALAGATFTLTNANGETIAAKDNTEIGVFTYEALPVGTYTLTENAAPEGYDLPENASWTVTVAEDGTVTVTGEGFNATSNTITNTKIPEPVTADFSFKKVDEKGAALLGATFTLTNAQGAQIFPKAGEPAAVFTYEDLPVGVYTLKETKAPAGFDLPENATWKVIVAEDGTVTVEGDCFNTENNTITNARTRFSLRLTKVDGANNSKKLKGARFSLSGTDYKQVLTTDNEGHVTFTDLLPGKYTLLEEKAPDGYLRSSTYQWKVTVYASGRIDVGSKQDVKTTLTIVNHKQGDIPQTGPVTWPKTLLLLLGGVMYVAGLLLVLPAMFKKRKPYED